MNVIFNNCYYILYMLLQHLGANVSYPFETAKSQNIFYGISMEYFYSFVKIDSFLIIGFFPEAHTYLARGIAQRRFMALPGDPSFLHEEELEIPKLKGTKDKNNYSVFSKK